MKLLYEIVKDQLERLPEESKFKNDLSKINKYYDACLTGDEKNKSRAFLNFIYSQLYSLTKNLGMSMNREKINEFIQIYKELLPLLKTYEKKGLIDMKEERKNIEYILANDLFRYVPRDQCQLIENLKEVLKRDFTKEESIEYALSRDTIATILEYHKINCEWDSPESLDSKIEKYRKYGLKADQIKEMTDQEAERFVRKKFLEYLQKYKGEIAVEICRGRKYSPIYYKRALNYLNLTEKIDLAKELGIEEDVQKYKEEYRKKAMEEFDNIYWSGMEEYQFLSLIKEYEKYGCLDLAKEAYIRWLKEKDAILLIGKSINVYNSIYGIDAILKELKEWGDPETIEKIEKLKQAYDEYKKYIENKKEELKNIRKNAAQL